MEQASRVTVIASAAVAAVVHGWLARWQPALAPAAFVAFAVSFAAARVAFRPTLAIVLGTAYLAPALLQFAFGTSDYHLLLVWLAALSGVLFAKLDWRRWHLPRPWLIPLVAWALVVAATWPVIAGREVDFNLAAVHTIEVGTKAFSAAPPVAAAFVVIFALGQLLTLLVLDLLWQEFGDAPSIVFVRAAVVPMVGGIGIGCLAGLYQGLFDITWMNPPIWASAGRAGGLALDANAFGTGAAIWAPLAIAASYWVQRDHRAAVAAFALLAAGMWTSGSRTALIVFAVGTTGVVAGVLQHRGLWRARVVAIGASVLAVAFLIALAVVPRDYHGSTGIGRAFARLPRLEAAEIMRFADEMWNRFDYGAAASRMIAEHPFTGIGVGAFHVLAPEYIYEKSGGARFVGGDNAQNWWRHQLAELGTIGALPSIWLSVILLWFVVRAHAIAQPTIATTMLRMVIAGVGLVSLVAVPTQHPATMLSVAMTMFVAGAALQRRPQRPVATAWWLAAFIVAAATMAGQIVSARGALRTPHRAEALGVPYNYGMAPIEGLSPYGEMRWIRSGALAVRLVERRWYGMTFWHPPPAESLMPVDVRVTIDGREVLRQAISGTEPVTFFFETPRDRPSFVVQFDVSPAYEPYALGFAQQWRDTLPPDVTPGQLLR